MTDLEPRLVTTEGASELLGGVDTDTIRRLVRSGELTGVMLASTPGVEPRKIFVVVSSIDELVTRLTEEARETDEAVA